jgi:hypothetical protein
MTTIWKPDTCHCVIEYNDKLECIKIHKSCTVHQGGDKQVMFNNCLKHNQSFNLKYGNIKLPKDFYDDTMGLSLPQQRIRAIKENRIDVIDVLDKMDEITKLKTAEKNKNIKKF